MPSIQSKPSTKTLGDGVILFGLTSEGKPQAGRFSADQADLAQKAAKSLGLTVLPVSGSPELVAVFAKIPAGRLYQNRKSFIPNVRRDLHDRLTQFAQASGDNSGPSGDMPGNATPPPAGIPTDWESITAGQLVIAQSSLADGWWEAIVLSRVGDMLTLRWRDYPREAAFAAHYATVALQQPQKPST